MHLIHLELSVDQTKQQCGKQKVQVQQESLCWEHWSVVHDKSNPSCGYSAPQLRRYFSNVYYYLWSGWGRSWFSSFFRCKNRGLVRSSDSLHVIPSGKGVRSGFRNKLKRGHLPAKVQQERFTVPSSLIIPQEICWSQGSTDTMQKKYPGVRSSPTGALAYGIGRGQSSLGNHHIRLRKKGRQVCSV